LKGVWADAVFARWCCCAQERRARQFLKERFEKRLKELHIPFRIEIARSCCDSDSIGELLCKRAEQLNAAMLLLSKEKRGAVKQFFIGRWDSSTLPQGFSCRQHRCLSLLR
jgi:hypothetical protein